MWDLLKSRSSAGIGLSTRELYVGTDIPCYR